MRVIRAKDVVRQIIGYGFIIEQTLYNAYTPQKPGQKTRSVAG